MLKGVPAASYYIDLLTSKINFLKSKNIIPALRVILVGEDSASKLYTQKKTEKCKEIGMDGEVINLPEKTTTAELLACLQKLNNDSQVHGILVQLPLPSHINESLVLESIVPSKDVDGFHPINIGRLQLQDKRALIPCTALGILKLLEYYKISIESKHVVVIGRSNIVGRPVSQLLSLKWALGNATVTICHSKTKDISHYTKQADIIIAAIGKPLYVNASMINKGVVLIDVGINPTPPKSKYVDRKKIVGDIDQDSVVEIASALSPVPGGIGPMTIAMLLNNTVQTAEQLLL